MVLLAAGGAATAIKMSKDDAKKIEKETGVSVEELTEDELAAAMKKLNIQSIELDENDKAIVAKETGQESKNTLTSAPVKQNDQPSYLKELEQLKKLLDQGVITQEEFEAKKAQLLNL
jgi:L-fucose isomerase-like protein